MLASVNTGEIHKALRNQTPADLGRMRAALADLPVSWERDRSPADCGPTEEHRQGPPVVLP
jgi:hypothetical protein